ncbi:hypothetical protein PSP6_170147 [Paraburkholderia tropica]|nr:hypothetical protein PSP6_170147 [Paraburkholderia tropica]
MSWTLPHWRRVGRRLRARANRRFRALAFWRAGARNGPRCAGSASRALDDGANHEQFARPVPIGAGAGRKWLLRVWFASVRRAPDGCQRRLDKMAAGRFARPATPIDRTNVASLAARARVPA